MGKPRELFLASGTPRSPEIKKNDLAMVFFQSHCLTGAVFQRKLRCGFAFISGLQDGADCRLISFIATPARLSSKAEVRR
jgi:hypothetical protein